MDGEKPKSKKALKHAARRARDKRRQTAQLDARYAAIVYREQRKERILENNKPKPAPAAPAIEETAAELAAS